MENPVPKALDVRQAHRAQHTFLRSSRHFSILCQPLQQPPAYLQVVQGPECIMKLGLESPAASDIAALRFRAVFSDELRVCWKHMKGKVLSHFWLRRWLAENEQAKFSLNKA